MVCLLRNLYNARPPINGFDQLPLHAEIFTEADFARIKTTETNWFMLAAMR